MPIRYITGGDEVKAKSLLGEGRHQLSILKNAMSFQKLKQLERMVTLPDGILIKCSSCFGLDIINVFAPTPEISIPVIEEEKIIPITKEPGEYDFSFKLTRGDGRIVAGYYNKDLVVTVFNSKKEKITITAPEYNETTQYWGFNLEDPEDKDPDGFWVSYDCAYGLLTQYPYLYMSDDRKKPEALIKYGIYEDIIPYWNVDTWVEPVPVSIPEFSYPPQEVIDLIYSGNLVHTSPGFYPEKRAFSRAGFTYRRKIKSSVPYEVAFQVKSHYFFYWFSRPDECSPDGGIVGDQVIPIYDVLTPGSTIICEGPDVPTSPKQQSTESANLTGTTYTMKAIPRLDTVQDAWCWTWTDEGTHSVWNPWKHQWEDLPGHWYKVYFTGEARWMSMYHIYELFVPLSLKFAPRK